jgi:hypothetical protein
MSLLDTASLIVTPNGYKEGKLYSVIPSDGSGDMSVTRATTATRVNSAGLVELVPYNLLLNTNTFSSWNLEGGTLTSGQTDPLGGNTAYKYVQASGGLWAGLNLPVMSAGTGATQSIWVKSVSGSNVTFNFGSGYSNQGLSNKTATSQWQLFTNSFAFSDGGSMYVSNISDPTNGIYVWHPQLVEGTSVKEYFPTIDRLNIPRLDYSNGTCPSLLVEPQRTNFTRNNNNLSGWVETIPADTITLNAGISPDGNSNAIKIIPSTTYGAHMIYDDTTNASSGGNFTMSCYAKASGYSKIGLRESASVGYYATFNLANGTIIDNGGNNASIVDMGNGWYRCIVSVAFSGNVNMGIIALNDAYTSGQPYFPYEFAGNGTSGVLIYGPQLETSASYATSLISTAGVSSATRNADVISKTGISSLIGQTEGTLYVDFNRQLTIAGGLQIGNSDGPNDYLNSIIVQWNDNGVYANVFVGGVNQFPITSSAVIGRHKLALAYKANDFALYIDGVQIAIDNSGSIPSLSALFFNHQNIGSTGSNTNTTAIYKTRLTNAELASLTSI